MRVEVGNYALIAGEEGKKAFLVLVTKIAGRKVHYELESKKPDSIVTGDADFNKIMAVYSDDAVSDFYSQSHLIEPYFRSFKHEAGDVHFFLKCDKKVKNKIEASITMCHKKLKKLKLDGFFPVDFHIKANKGKQLGVYKAVKDTEKQKDVITIRISESYLNETGIEYVLMHEFGHGVWFRVFTRRQRAQWIELFRDRCNSIDMNEKSLRKMRKAIESGRVSLQEFMKKVKEDSDEGDSTKITLLKNTFKYIKDKYHVSIDELNNLIDDGKSLEKYWPSSGVPLPQFNIGPTEYSKTNAKEFFAECFAHYMCGQKDDVPDYALKLLSKTL